ncbi:MAG: hypothetical protein PWP65_1961 [Clostridia bacterium]|nr:hypothetical protein [Clostridia bacterium]
MKRYLILALLALSCLTWPLASAGAPTPQEGLRQRLETMQAQELALAQELLAIETNLQQAEKETLRLQKEIEILKQELEAARHREALLLSTLQESRHKLNGILRFLQKEATHSYVATILSSQNLSDFIIRWELCQRIMQFCLNNVKQNMGLYQEAQKQSREITHKEKVLQQTFIALQVQQNKLQELKKKRAAQLAKIKEEVVHYSEALQALDAAWSEAIPTLQYLLNNFSSFPWSKLKPDEVKVELFRGQVLALFSEANLNRTLLAGNDKLQKVSFRLTHERLGVVGPDFCIEGSLKVTGDRNLAFCPQSLEFSGIKLQRSIWDLLLPGPEIHIEMPPPDYGLKFKDLKTEDKQLILILKR